MTDARISTAVGPVDRVGHRSRVRGGVVCGVGSGLTGQRPKLRRVLSDPYATVIVVEHRDRLACFGVEQGGGLLAGQGRRIVVADPGDPVGDLVWDMIWVLTGGCARRFGRGGARNRAMRAVTAAKRDPISQTWAG